MFLDKFLAKKGIVKSSPSVAPAVVTDYTAGDKNLDFAILPYLAGKTDYLDCLQTIIEQMAYHPGYQIEENKCIFDCLSDILESATWMTEWDPYKSGDYNPDRPGSWLGCIASSYYNYDGQNNDKYEEMKSMIEARDYTPAEALKMIQEHWDKLYKYQGGYEAIEFCLVCSENYTEPAYINSAIRDLGYKLGPIRNSLEKK